MQLKRRDLVLGTSALGVSALGAGFAVQARATMDLPDYLHGNALMDDVVRYDGFGVHRSGSPSDIQTTAWMADHLAANGYDVEHVPFNVAQFEPGISTVNLGSNAIELAPQWPVMGPVRISGPIAHITTLGRLDGMIALATFPYNKRSAIDLPAYWAILTDAKTRGAVGVVAITEGPTGDIIEMNAPRPGIVLPVPVGLAAPRDAPLLHRAAQAKRSVIFTLAGQNLANVTAKTVLGHLDRRGDTIVVSTPMSAWTHAGGERGPGIALLRALAHWAAEHGKSRYVFLATSGHEFNHAGFDAALPRLAALVPKQTCKLWLHLGANIGVRALSDDGSRQLSNRASRGGWLAGTPSTLAGLTARFAGVDGLWPPVPATRHLVVGELKSIITAGYAPAIGLFGAGPLHHTQRDRADATSPNLLEAVAKPLLQTLMAWDR
jgi:hypothetical protein